MQELYDKVAQELTDTLIKYFDNEKSLKEVEKAQERETLVLSYENWKEIKTNLKESIFNLTKQLYIDINECDQRIRTFKSLNATNEFNIDESSLISQSLYMSRNKAPPVGFENSNWYIGPYPTIQMIEALNENIEEIN